MSRPHVDGDGRVAIADLQQRECRIGHHELAQRHDVDQPAIDRIEDVHGVDRTPGLAGISNVGERTLHRPRRGRLDVLRGHDAAGGRRRIVQQRAQ
jgi:hypothetical protein